MRSTGVHLVIVVMLAAFDAGLDRILPYRAARCQAPLPLDVAQTTSHEQELRCVSMLLCSDATSSSLGWQYGISQA